MSLFNLETLAIRDTSFCQLKHPATDELLFADEDKKQPVGIELLSTSSKEYRAAVLAMNNRSLKRGKKVVSAEVLREEGTNLLVTCSVEAKGFNYKGAALDNADAFHDLYTDSSMVWVRDQVDAYLGDVSNFLQVS